MVAGNLHKPLLGTLAMAQRSRLEQPAALVGHIVLGQLELAEHIGLALDIELVVQHIPPHTLALDKLEQLAELGPGTLGELGTLAFVAEQLAIVELGLDTLEQLDKPVVMQLVALFV
jgi:hypothetical protein